MELLDFEAGEDVGAGVEDAEKSDVVGLPPERLHLAKDPQRGVFLVVEYGAGDEEIPRRGAGLDAVGFLHAPEELGGLIDVSVLQVPRDHHVPGDDVAADAQSLHPREEIMGLAAVAGLRVPTDQRIPGEDVAVQSGVEGPASVFQQVALGVHVDERVADELEPGESGLGGSGVELGAGAAVLEGGAGGDGAREGDVVGVHAGLLHLEEES